MNKVNINMRRMFEAIFLSPRSRYLFLILLILSYPFPSFVLAQPFNIARVRGAVVRVIADRGNSTGSGSIIKLEGTRGYILTAYHVIKQDVINQVHHVNVELHTEQVLKAHISPRRMDVDYDIAVLTVDNLPVPLPPVILWGDSAALRDTQRVYALGHPHAGPFWAITDGTVSKLEGGKIYFSGTAVSPGNSGGPLLNEDGAMVGMNLELQKPLGNALEGDVIRGIIRTWVGGLPMAYNHKPPPGVPAPAPPETKDKLIKELTDFLIKE